MLNVETRFGQLRRTGFRMLARLCLLGGMWWGCGCEAKHIVTPIGDAKDTTKGLFYALPRTVIVIELPVTRRIASPNELVKALTNANDVAALQAKIKADLQVDPDSILQTTTEKKFTAGPAVISSKAEPDPKRVYYVEVKAGFFTQNAWDFEWSDTGLISSSNSNVTDKSADFVIKTLQVAGSIAGAVLKGHPAANSTEALAQLSQVVDQLKKIKARRESLVFQSQGADITGVSQVLTELDREEVSLKAMLQGSIDETTVTLHFEYRKETLTENDTSTLFSLSTKEGIANLATECTTRPAPETDWLVENPGNKKDVVMKLSFWPKAEEQLFAKMPEPATGERSYYYRVPAQVAVDVSAGNTDAKRQIIAVAQLGKLESLPVSLGGTGSVIKPAFFVETGALKTLSTSSTPLDLSAVEGVGTTATGVIDAINAKNAAQKAASDQLTVLKRQGDLLEQQKRIRDLKKDLGQ